VLAVVIFHAFPSLLPGGFVGVDIFFVISGYLIGGIILGSLNAGNFSFRNFYARRARRIFPALIVVLASAFAFGWFALLPDEYLNLSRHVRDSAIFIENFRLLKEVSYWDAAAQTKPLLHLWSLAIEEQFYLAFPLLMFLMFKAARRYWLTLISGLAIVSFFAGLHPSMRDFYSPLTRGWELLAGAILWSLARQTPDNPGRVLRQLSATAGLILLVAGLASLHNGVPYPGWRALLPVGGAVLLIAAGTRAWVNRYVLRHKIAVAIGLISYPLYLWHWVLLAYAYIINDGLPAETWKLRGGLAALAFVLATLTYFLIEKPIRFGKRWQTGKVYFLLAAMAAIYAAGWWVRLRDGVPERLPAEINNAAAANQLKFSRELTTAVFDGYQYSCLTVNPQSPSTLFVGDSNLQMYIPRLRFLAEKEPINNLIIFATASAIPLPGMEYEKIYPWLNGADNYAGKALDFARQNAAVEKVVIVANWTARFSSEDGAAGSREPTKIRFKYGGENSSMMLDLLRAYIADFRQAGKKVYLVLSIPTGNELAKRYALERNLTDFPAMIHGQNSGGKSGVNREILAQRNGELEAELERIGKEAGATLIKPWDYLCSPDWCDASDANGLPIYGDAYHLTGQFVRDHVAYLDETVMPEK
jgi:peptidoglycan/LPS O-acetylase OafA/YrhL